jgi:branched-chain amino acid transport system permease protein
MNHRLLNGQRLSGIEVSRFGVLASAVVGGLLVLSFVDNPGLFVDQAIGGLVYGMILVLIALGLSIILGLLGIVNFAHGALVMLGAYVTFEIMTQIGLSFWVALVIAPVIIGLVGIIIERGVLQFVYDEDPLVGLLATFGLSLMFTELVRAFWGGGPKGVPLPQALSASTDLGVTTVARFRLFTVIVGALTVIAVYLFIERTSFGLSIRAGVLDREMAEFLGINMPVRFIAMFFLGSFIAGLGGVLRGAEVGMDLGMGEHFIILAFVVVAVGGIGSLFGSVFAGLLIGEAQYLTPVVLRTLATVTGVQWLAIPGIDGLVPYLVMIVVLLVRPRGLFGQEGFLE